MDAQRIPLSDGRDLATRVVTYPIPSDEQRVLIDLWRTAWPRANNCDWLAAMSGDYADSLTIQTVVGAVDGVPVGTASNHYSVRDPQVAVIGSVLTHPDLRGLGIGRHLTAAATKLAFDAGCGVAYLATGRRPDSLYLRCGFHWYNGGVMRCPAPGHDACEDELYAAGQITTIRPAVWGDLPAMACLYAQPLETFVLDYPRGYVSGKYDRLGLCASVFPRVHDEVAGRGGAMLMVVGDAAHNMLGFGSITPEPAPSRRHLAILDAVVHDDYADRLESLVGRLVAEAQPLEVQALQAFVAEPDGPNRDCFSEAGFQPVTRLSDQLRVGDRRVDVELMEKRLDD